MGPRLRTVIMWLLMAALPVQSWAVATMLNCGPTHHRMAGHAASVHSPAQNHDGHAQDAHAQMAHDHASHHHDMAAGADQAHADREQADQEQADPDLQPLSMGKFKCSACATCCLGMALPSHALTFDASVSSDTVEPGMPQGHVDFLTAGLERPPRTFLA